MSLSSFIKENEHAILKDWEEFAHTHIAPAQEMNSMELRNYLSRILKLIANDLDTVQIDFAPQEKPEVKDTKAVETADSVAATYADLRFIEGCEALDLMAEFRALRASVIRRWESERCRTELDYAEMVRFNEAIDQVSSEGFARHAEKVNHARNLFLASLVHDLRNPLGTVSLAAQMLKTMPILDEKQKVLTDQIFVSTNRAVELVSGLIDYARARLGKGLPVNIHPMNIEAAVKLAVAEIEIAHPERKITIWAEGDLNGYWDAVRIGQALSNLIGNAIQHGESGTTVDIVARGEETEIMLSVRNHGIPIPPAFLPYIFDAMVQGSDGEDSISASDSLGLGLFIVKEVVLAHGGKIDVNSTENTGTTFTICFPRKKPETPCDAWCAVSAI